MWEVNIRRRRGRSVPVARQGVGEAEGGEKNALHLTQTSGVGLM